MDDWTNPERTMRVLADFPIRSRPDGNVVPDLSEMSDRDLLEHLSTWRHLAESEAARAETGLCLEEAEAALRAVTDESMTRLYEAHAALERVDPP